MIPCIHGKVPAEGIALFGKWPTTDTQELDKHKTPTQTILWFYDTSHCYTALYPEGNANPTLVTALKCLWASRMANIKKRWAHPKFSKWLWTPLLKICLVKPVEAALCYFHLSTIVFGCADKDIVLPAEECTPAGNSKASPQLHAL